VSFAETNEIWKLILSGRNGMSQDREMSWWTISYPSILFVRERVAKKHHI